MVDKKKGGKIRLFILMGILFILLGYSAFQHLFLEIKEVSGPHFIDLSTKEGGETVIILFTTMDVRRHWYSSGRKRFVRILVDDKEVVSRVCDFYWKWRIHPAVYCFLPEVKVNLGKHKITVEDRYYKIMFEAEVEITEKDLRTLKENHDDDPGLILEIHAPTQRVFKFLGRYR